MNRERQQLVTIKRKPKKLPTRTINIWNKYDFAMSGLGEKVKFFGRIKHFRKCVKWSVQRITGVALVNLCKSYKNAEVCKNILLITGDDVLSFR